MKSAYDPYHLPVETFARAGDRLNSTRPLREFERLVDVAQSAVDQLVVEFFAHGFVRTDAAGSDAVWLAVSAQTAVPLTCQRCLEPFATPVAFERHFRFVATEQQAQAEDETAEEDLLVLSRDFNLLDLVEDELLLALPLVPMHAHCPQDLKLQVADADFDAAAPEKTNPFAALAQLKNNT